MGVYINGMEMPKNCRACRFAGFGGRRCELNVCMFTGESQPTLSPERMSNCPLVHVPPHGDLIDRDEMRETIKPWSPEDEMAGCTFDTVKKLMHTMISRAPVVIPAEPPKEE